MAKGFIPPDTALVQSTPVLAVLGKLVLLQTIAVLCTAEMQKAASVASALVLFFPHLLC